MTINYNNIFLMDDDENINFYNEDLLSEMKQIKDIEVYTNCNKALEFLDTSIEKGSLPGTWFVDINMPHMNGFQFLDKAFDRIQNTGILPSIYMLSSSIHPKDQTEYNKRDFIKGFIAKPLMENHLNTIFNV